MDSTQRLSAVIEQHEASLLEGWLAAQEAHLPIRPGERVAERKTASAAFLHALRSGLVQNSPLDDLRHEGWSPLRALLTELSQDSAREGRSAVDAAQLYLTFLRPLSEQLLASCAREEFLPTLWDATRLIESIGLHITSVYQRARDDIIRRQQQEMLELSTPVIKVWDGILALPIIGTLDSARTQTVMENLLQRVVETGSDIAIIDITGVPTVDTLTAQHLLKTVTATRLMGGECIISGIRPQIAQTLVQLGVDLGDVLTRSTLAGALALALSRRRLTIAPVEGAQESVPREDAH